MKTFTPSQLDAINNPARRIVVAAGAGSGKTSVLCERVARMIRDGIMPSTIVCITFTTAGAREFEKRINAILGGQFKLGFCGTLHAFILRLMRHHHALIGFPARISMLDEEQAAALVEQVRTDLKIKQLTKRELQEALDHGPGRYVKAEPWQVLSKPELVAAEYFRRLVAGGLLDFDSVLTFGALLIERMRDASGNIITLFDFKHMLWDEFQDSGDADMKIAGLFYHSMKSFFVVGDPDQSVYGFRGAKPEHIISLCGDDFFTMIKLEENFRCDREICDIANVLISHNTDRVDKKTISATGGEGVVKIIQAANEQGEVIELATDLSKHDNLNECAVLLRSNVLVNQFTLWLQGRGVPVKQRQHQQKPPDWKQAREFLNLLASPENDQLAFWWIQTTKGAVDARLAKQKASAALVSINQATLKIPLDVSLSDVPQIVARAGISAESVALLNIAAESLGDDATLADLSLALNEEDTFKQDEGEGVTVCTYHVAKGREFDCVFLPAFEQGVIPTGSKSVNIDEERRIAYVGFTRARHRLVISYSRMRKPAYGFGVAVGVEPSRFIAEAGL